MEAKSLQVQLDGVMLGKVGLGGGVGYYLQQNFMSRLVMASVFDPFLQINNRFGNCCGENLSPHGARFAVRLSVGGSVKGWGVEKIYPGTVVSWE